MSASDGPERSDSSGADAERADGNGRQSDGRSDTPDEPEVTPQSRALRRQQYAVGVGAAIVAGFALAISSIQHSPDLPESVPLVAGFVGAGLVYWIVRHSLFPTDDDRSASE